MLISGYNQTERDIIVGEGVARCNNLIAKVNKGHRLIYRISARKKYYRAVQKILKKKKWYGEQTETVVYVQATLGVGEFGFTSTNQIKSNLERNLQSSNQIKSNLSNRP